MTTVDPSEKSGSHERYWEIDLLRGTAVLMMIAFHFVFDLNFLRIYKVQVYSGWLGVFAYTIGTMFLLLVGVSLTISYRRAKGHLESTQLGWKYSKRGLEIFGLGIVITAVTLVYPGNGFVVFGILHCIGLSIIISYLLLPYKWLSLAIGAMIVALGIIVVQRTYSLPWLVWLGFAPHGFYSIDYFPILPWLGVVLIGIFIGNMVYPDRVQVLRKVNTDRVPLTRPIRYLGQHSLVIYLLHQPILFAILYPLATSI
jgi:uncharacterized membrane protein